MTRSESSSPRSPYAWSSGAWFGPLLGCTLWMALFGVQAWAHDTTAGVVTLAGYLFANALGFVLWWRRKDLRAPVAIQIQLGVTFLLALGVLEFIDGRLDVTQLQGGFSTRQIQSTLLVYPVLMFVFWTRDRAARHAS